MSTLSQAQAFFFISSVGFVLLWVLCAVLLYYLIKASRIFSKIMQKFEKDVNHIGDTTKEILRKREKVEKNKSKIIINLRESKSYEKK
jgi:hypothetical protein